MKLSLLFTAATAFAATAIPSALQTISKDLVALNSTVAEWHGLPLHLIPIIAQSTQLLDDIKKGTKTAEASDTLTTEEALGVAQDTVDLANNAHSTIDTIIATKKKFDFYIIASPILKKMLEDQKAATVTFSNAVISKVPEALQPIAKDLIEPIYADFDRAIAAYK